MSTYHLCAISFVVLPSSELFGLHTKLASYASRMYFWALCLFFIGGLLGLFTSWGQIFICVRAFIGKKPSSDSAEAFGAPYVLGGCLFFHRRSFESLA
jgi:hypothetical protein